MCAGALRRRVPWRPVTERSDSQRTGAERPGRGLSRRTWTLLVSFGLVVLLGVLGSTVRVPYVALGPGPTYDTLSSVGGKPVVRITDAKTYPTAGQLRMTTVSLIDGVTLFGALGLWMSGRQALAPREDYFAPGESREQVEQRNVAEFQNSQSLAEVAALRYLGYPVRVVASDVVRDGPAGKAIKPGDALVGLNGNKVRNARQVFDALRSTKPGQQATLEVRTGKQPKRTERVRLGSSPDRPQGYLGITPIEQADVPFRIEFSLADVGGPSAGLAFALTIVDKLRAGELNGGKRIAGTGTINERGEVGPIGGIEFKLLASREAGATAFLTPAANCPAAKASVPEGLRLLKVNSLTDAVSALRQLREGKQPQGC